MRYRSSAVLAVAFGAMIGATPAVAEPPSATPKAKLAVLVVFDQLRGDFLERWQPLFVDDGFRRLQTEGAWFDNCHYPYAMTATGPGHAAMLSGCSGDRHGIIANNWYDRRQGADVYCAANERYERVPPSPKKPKDTDSKPAKPAKGEESEKKKPTGYGAPTLLMAPTMGDVIKERGGRVFGISLKDRSAILPAGTKPDGVYWFSGGQYVTSTYYRDRVHPWVARFNEARSFDRWFGTYWDRLHRDLDYTQHSGPDDGPGEDEGAGPKDGPKQGVTFPHRFAFGDKIDSHYYEALANSPMGNDVVYDLMRLAVVEEQLGQRDVPDLLIVSFSSNDLIGHCWGPDSHEVLDVTLRSDLLLRDMLKFLDEKVGKGNYVIGLTADHGICPLPEFTQSQGKPAQRIDPALLLAELETHLRAKFGDTGDPKDSKTRYIEAANEGGVYLNRRAIEARSVSVDAVADEVVAWLKTRSEIETAYTAAALAGALPESDTLGRLAQKGFMPDRSGDVIMFQKPYSLMGNRRTGTNHGSPYPYDTHVPLLVFGPGVKGGRRNDRVTPQALALILSHAVGVEPPKMAEAPLPTGLFE